MTCPDDNIVVINDGTRVADTMPYKNSNMKITYMDEAPQEGHVRAGQSLQLAERGDVRTTWVKFVHRTGETTLVPYAALQHHPCGAGDGSS